MIPDARYKYQNDFGSCMRWQIFLILALLLFGCSEYERKKEIVNQTKNELKEPLFDDIYEVSEMEITSPAFEHEGIIPKHYTCDGEDVSPPIEIEGLPKDAKSMVLIVDDPDAPSGVFTHWILFNINPRGRIDEGSAPGTQGHNDFGKDAYGGPCPPSGTHRYFFRLYALDTELSIKEGASKKELLAVMEGHVLASAEVIGRYSR